VAERIPEMRNIGLVMLAFAFVFAVIAGTIMVTAGRWHFGWTSVAFWIASELIGGISRIVP